MDDLGHWTLYPGTDLPEDFADNPPLGFVYVITRKSDGKFYIGQKKIIKIERRPPLKGKTRKRKVVKQSDWKKYSGSSNELKADIAELGEEAFTFEIAEFCNTKWLMSYEELRLQMLNDVMFREDSYNGIVNVRLSKFQSIIEEYGQMYRVKEPFKRDDNKSQSIDDN